MLKQRAIRGLGDAMKKKVTRLEMFLVDMDAVAPWMRLLALIAPHYPKCPSSEFFAMLRQFRNGGSGSISFSA